jgi:hypothetical protein
VCQPGRFSVAQQLPEALEALEERIDVRRVGGAGLRVGSPQLRAGDDEPRDGMGLVARLSAVAWQRREAELFQEECHELVLVGSSDNAVNATVPKTALSRRCFRFGAGLPLEGGSCVEAGGGVDALLGAFDVRARVTAGVPVTGVSSASSPCASAPDKRSGRLRERPRSGGATTAIGPNSVVDPMGRDGSGCISSSINAT